MYMAQDKGGPGKGAFMNTCMLACMHVPPDGGRVQRPARGARAQPASQYIYIYIYIHIMSPLNNNPPP